MLFISSSTQNNAGIFYNTGGNNWQNLVNFNSSIRCLCLYHNKLYVGGDFTQVNGMPASFIACYDGTSWSALGSGIWCTQFPGHVTAMCVWNDKLIVGGSFDQAGGQSVHSVAAWNDTTWSDVGGGGVIDTLAPTLVAQLNAICSYNGSLIIAGYISHNSSQTVTANRIIGYNGNNWFTLGSGLQGTPNSVFSWDSTLYVGGSFQSAGGVLGTHYIAKWKNTTWAPVGSGLEGETFAFAVYDSILYAGGLGYEIDGNIVPGIVRLMDYPDTFLIDTTGISEIKDDDLRIEIYPNPATETVTVTTENIKEIRVTNLLGQIMQNTNYVTLKNEVELNIELLPQGIYLLQVRTKSEVSNVKFIKQ